MSKPVSDLSSEERLRYELRQLLAGQNAHMTFEQATDDFPEQHINTFPTNVPYTFWHLVEHVRIAQTDFLAFIMDPAYESPVWPDGYWPDSRARATPGTWRDSLDAFLADRARLVALIEDQRIDLFAELPHAPGYTIFREINVVADHNAYHIGELAILRQVMNIW